MKKSSVSLQIIQISIISRLEYLFILCFLEDPFHLHHLVPKGTDIGKRLHQCGGLFNDLFQTADPLFSLVEEKNW